MTAGRTRDAALLGGLIMTLLAGTCLLPYRFPPQMFVVGASYEVGFSNAVSFLAYLTLLPFIAVVCARRLPSTDWRPASDPPGRPTRLIAAIPALVVLVHLAAFGAVYAYKGRFTLAEGLYFQSLLYRMSLGDIPYLDFSFYYGPSMLYPGHWLSRILGLDAGYGVWFVATYTTGLLFLYAVLRTCLDNRRTAALWFAFLAFGLFNPLTGLNVTFTRYLFPTVVFVAVERFLTVGGAWRGALAAILLAVALTYSFEVALLSAAAVVALMVGHATTTRIRTLFVRIVRWTVNARTEEPVPDEPSDAHASAWRMVARGLLLLVVGVSATAACFLLIDPSGRVLMDYPGIARSYSGGAHNVPIYPHLPLLALSAVTVLTLAGLLRFVASRGLDAVAVSAVVFAGLAVVAQRASFGAAEPSHFAYYGLPVFLLSLFLATRAAQARAARTVIAVALLVGIMLPMQYYYSMEFAPFVAQRLGFASGPGASGGAGARSASTSLEADLRDVVRQLGTARPYVMYEMEYSSLPIYREFSLRYAMYSTMLITARDEDGIRRAIADVRASRAIVVARERDLTGLGRPWRSTGLLRALDLVSGAHTAGSDLNAILLRSRTRLTAPFLEFVRTEYVPLLERNGVVAFGPR